jgi:predicted dehydrogenase
VDPGLEGRHEMLVSYRTGDMWAPRLDATEALSVAARDFLDWIDIGRDPVTGGAVGLRVVRILEAATKSMQQQGQLVDLDLAEAGE